MFLTEAAFKRLTSGPHRHNMVDKDSKSSLHSFFVMTLKQSAAGDCYTYKDERLSVVVTLPIPGGRRGSFKTVFFREGFSNFTGIHAPPTEATSVFSPTAPVGESLKEATLAWGLALAEDEPAGERTFAPCVVAGEQINFFNGEMMFKAACAVSQMDPDDTSSPKALAQLAVLDAVMSASTPLECKNATRGLPLDKAAWDEAAPDVMLGVQLWKCMDPEFHAAMTMVGCHAVEHGIPMDRCFWYEAAKVLKDDGTEKFNDLIWGTGHTVDEMHTMTLANLDEDWLTGLPGKNGLGVALTHAFRRVVGLRGEFLGATVQQYIARVGEESSCFTHYPSDKRARTDSYTAADALPDQSCEYPMLSRPNAANPLRPGIPLMRAESANREA
jgi:predicted NAD-dependent protein-ADP-ribosyltransferase YbiA (DUF1768 family)